LDSVSQFGGYFGVPQFGKEDTSRLILMIKKERTSIPELSVEILISIYEAAPQVLLSKRDLAVCSMMDVNHR